MKGIKWACVTITVAILGAAACVWRTEIESAHVTVAGREFMVRVADSASERERGMSKKTDGGMLFVFSRPEVQFFWMHDMLIPLDVLWIEEGEVVDIDWSVPAPGFGEEPARMDSSPYEVRYVLELPAGEAEGILPGSTVEIVLDEGARLW